MFGDEKDGGKKGEPPELDDQNEGDEADDADAEEGDEAEDETEEGDADAEDGEGGDDDLAAGAGEGDGKVSRRTARVQKLEKERDEYRQKYEQALNDLRKTPAQPAAPAEDPQAEAAKIAAMEPVDRVAYLAEKRIKALEAQIQGFGFQTSDATDRAAYEAKSVVDPLYTKYRDRVEEALKGMRANGANSSREAILTYLIGEDARKRAAQKPDDKRRKAAASRVDSARGKPANARSDSSGSRSEKSLEDRLRGVQI